MSKTYGPFDSPLQFRLGDRVELHPAMDLWMRGARYGEVTFIGKNKINVRLDYKLGASESPANDLTGRKKGSVVRLTPEQIGAIID